MRAHVLAAIAAAALEACTAQAADMRRVASDDETLAESGPTEAGGWQSAPWTDARWISLPGRTAVEIEHALGRRPDAVLVYLSFDGDDREGPERAAFLGAGDVAQISGVSASSVTIENTTSANFYLRVVLE